MNQRYALGIIIPFAAIAIALQSNCRPESKNEQRKENAASAQAPLTKPEANVEDKSPHSQPPSFTPNAVITLADSTAIEVADFAFYSDWRGFEGGMYTPNSGNLDWPLTIKVGPLWKKYSFKDVKAIELPKDENSDFAAMKMSLLNGTLITGKYPRTGQDAWFEHGTFYLLGESEALSRTGQFRCEVSDLVRIERLEQGGASIKFRVTHRGGPNGAQLTTDVANPKLELSWSNDQPVYVDIYAIGDDMPVQIQNTEVKVKPKEIDSISLIPGQTTKFSIKMKNGDLAKAELPARIYGKLANGDVLFTTLYENDRPVIKSILIK